METGGQIPDCSLRDLVTCFLKEKQISMASTCKAQSRTKQHPPAPPLFSLHTDIESPFSSLLVSFCRGNASLTVDAFALQLPPEILRPHGSRTRGKVAIVSVSNPHGSGVRVAHGDSSGTVTLTLSGERSDHR